MTHSSNKSHAPAHRERTCILEIPCDMTRSYKWHDTLIYNTRSSVSQPYLHSEDSVWHDSLICESCLIHLWDMTHSLNWYHTGASRKRTCILKIPCDMTHSYVRRVSLICDSFVRVTRDSRTKQFPHSNESRAYFYSRKYEGLTSQYLICRT